MRSISANYGNGIYEINGTAVICGEDIGFSFTGGTRPHIGAVSIAVYEPVRDSATVSTVTVYEHRDDRLSAKYAKEAAGRFKCTVTVSVGIHVNDADEEDLKVLVYNFNACCQKISEQILQIRKKSWKEGEGQNAGK